MPKLPFQEPDWATAPPWAEFWAVDRNGVAYWYAVAPVLGTSVWWNQLHTQRRRVAPIGVRCAVDMRQIDWRATERQRAETQEKIPYLAAPAARGET